MLAAGGVHGFTEMKESSQREGVYDAAYEFRAVSRRCGVVMTNGDGLCSNAGRADCRAFESRCGGEGESP